ncbi:prolyl oligopeptidase family serine peptidase [Hyphococcus luteus]|uniref:prolyl oligopeptidase n=1 Tax=Hyphococcus luteus TaxID=2058213 RepID=A0A2S7K160_9PROT|nr:prolyl oligopeptidase family serine peptidase [Marinicaulis flavus]PQA86191.1 S9 family peptidase [Marinicaulis flavus]
MTKLTYPETRRTDQSDAHFGVTVVDPYRWLENDVREDEDVAAWVAAQNEATFGYLKALPGRAQIEKRLRTLWNYEKFTLPSQKGGRIFYGHNDGLQNQFVLYTQDDKELPRVLLDPNKWSEDGATALAAYYPSPDGSLVAYMVQDGGSDWNTIRTVDATTGAVLSDEIEWVKFSGVSWAKNGSGFYYSRYPEPEEGEAFQSLNLGQAVYFHKIGDAQAKDARVYARPEAPETGFSAEVSSDGASLIVTAWKGTDSRYEVVLIDLENPDADPVDLVTGFAHDYSYIATAEGRHFFFSDENAPKGKVVSTPAKPGAGAVQWMEVIPEADGVLSGVNIVGGRIFANYMEDVKSAVHLFALDGAPLGGVDLPGPGTAIGFGGEPDDAETFYSFESFNRPPTLYRYDIASGALSVFREPEAPFDPNDYEVAQVFYPSKDGTKIPMFIAHKKGLDLSDGAPTLLYGYGGFNVSLTPGFSVTRLQWMEMGGVYALANLRGGGEYGKAWHDAGRLENKQNVFDDFIAAGEYLIGEGIATKDKLAILGGSNGGLLVGAVINQRPDLFAAGLPAVGVMDMLRFNQFTAGRFWTDDYGDPSSEADFRNLYAYSPYHNIHNGEAYPAILVTTADTDDRVVPGHSFKYAAALQAAEIGDKPHLIRIETRAGHGAGKPTEKIIEEYADMWAFIAHETGLCVPAA